MSELNLRRMLRYAMAYHHVFKEPRKGFVSHTAASRRLVEDPFARAGLGYMFEEVWQGFAHVRLLKHLKFAFYLGRLGN